MKRIAALLLFFLMAGCTPSLNSLSTDQDRTIDPALLGGWRSTDDGSKDRFEVLRDRDGAYRVVLYEANQEPGTFTVRLVQLGQLRFIDLYPDEPLGDGFWKGHFIRVHTFGRISLDGNRLRIGMLDPDWFKTEEGRKASLPMMPVEGGSLLTAGTKQLREFAASYAASKAFGDTNEWAVYVREK